MKYFTTEWCNGLLIDQEMDNRIECYNAYIEDIFERLPVSLKILSKMMSLHDGIIQEVHFYSRNNALTINGIFGDLQVGYFALTIKYKELLSPKAIEWSQLFNNRELIVSADEFELSLNNYFEHRILFGSKEELAITFKDLELNIRTISAQDYKITNCHYFHS